MLDIALCMMDGCAYDGILSMTGGVRSELTLFSKVFDPEKFTDHTECSICLEDF